MKQVIGRLNPLDKHVTIWGAGFSGLVLGYYLKEQGYKITIYERSSGPGGKIQTKKNPHGPVETGPNALYMNVDGMDLLKELKLEPIPATKKLKRLLMIAGKLKRPLQMGLLTKITMNGFKHPPLINDGLTVADFFIPLIGRNHVNNLISPVLSGIYAASADRLQFKSIFHEVSHISQFESYWAFFKFLMKNQKGKPRLEISGSVSFDGGMQALINRLAEVLGSDIKYNYKEKFRIKGNTILCTDAYNGSLLTQEIRPEMSVELSRINYQELSTATVFLKRAIKSLHKSFGVLIPLKSGYHSMGIINNKAIFPSNYQNVYSYTFILSGKCSAKEIQEDIMKLAGDVIPEDILEIVNTHWERAIPLYNFQRYLSIKKLHQLASKEEHFAIFGNYVAGISLREMITAARKFAQNPV